MGPTCCVPHCVSGLLKFYHGKQGRLASGVPIVSGSQVNHCDNCYFCLCKVSGYNKKNKKDIAYPNLPSAMRPIPHGQGVPFPKLHEFTEIWTMSSSSDDDIGLDVYKPDSAMEL